MTRGNPVALAQYRLRRKEAELTGKCWFCNYCDLFFSRQESGDEVSEKPACPYCGWDVHVERKKA